MRVRRRREVTRLNLPAYVYSHWNYFVCWMLWCQLGVYDGLRSEPDVYLIHLNSSSIRCLQTCVVQAVGACWFEPRRRTKVRLQVLAQAVVMGISSGFGAVTDPSEKQAGISKMRVTLVFTHLLDFYPCSKPDDFSDLLEKCTFIVKRPN